MKMESAIHQQRIIMPLDEALELGDIVIKGRAMPGRTGNQSEEYKYQFLNIPEIFTQFKELPNNEHDKLGYGIEYVGYIAYLVRTQDGSELEVKRVGCLKDFPEFTKLVANKMPLSKNTKTKDLERMLKISADQWFERYTWTEKGSSTTIVMDDKKYLNDDETKKLLGIEGHRTRVAEYVDKNWKLAILSSCPRTKSPEIYDFLDINLGIPESVMYESQDRPYAVLNYTGSISLENQILRDLVKPKRIGNGVITMSEDRMPKYLKRVLSLA